MSYTCYLGGMEVPTPAKLTVKIKGKNKTLVLLNEGEINFLRTPGLTEITVPLVLPMLGGVRSPSVYLDMLEELKTGKRTTQFILVRSSPSGGKLFDTNIKVSVEDYNIVEDVKANGLDVAVDVSLKQWRDYGTIHIYLNSTCKGSKQALLVLTERRTRMGIVILVEDHTAASVVKAINSLERRFGKLFYKLFKSITVDNGCEFQDFEGIEMSHRRKGKRTIVFFCHPYSAYERGSNENMNRLIRRFFPKGTNFDNVTKEQVAEAERWVNHYPRKLLGWKSAAMLFDQELQAA